MKISTFSTLKKEYGNTVGSVSSLVGDLLMYVGSPY
jgi:hypothetical protein